MELAGATISGSQKSAGVRGERPRLALATLQAEPTATLLRMRELARRHPPRRYRLVEDLKDADLVLFVEHGYVGLPHLLRLKGLPRGVQPLLFSESDWVYPALPTAAPSLRLDLPWAVSWSYLLDDEPFDDGQQPAAPQYLFSFVGRLDTHAIRRRLARLDSPSTPCLAAQDAPNRFTDWDYRRGYEGLLRNSQFVLCPRGFGVSSIRLFEAMRVGRAPIIVSDDWREPPIGDWSKFSFRVPEHAISSIPALCERHADRWREMGLQARLAYERHFAPDVFLDRMLDTLTANLAERPPPPLWLRALRSLRLRDIRSLR